MAGSSHPSRDRQPSHPRPMRMSPLRLCAIIILTLIILLGVAILIAWLVLRPAPLEYTVEDARVHGFSVTDNSLNATFDLSLRVSNRNRKVAIYYDSIEVTVWYSDQTVAFADVAPFFQAQRNVTRLDVVAEARSMPLARSAASSLKHDKSGGKAEFEVMVRARMRFRIGLVKTKHYTMKVDCAPVVVHFSSSVPFHRTYCDVDI